jgi:hypothetical protein
VDAKRDVVEKLNVFFDINKTMESIVGSPLSLQGKVFSATFVVGMLLELVGEVLLYRTIPEGRGNLKTRFWARYVVELALATLLGGMGFICTEVLAHSGWTKSAWLVALVPTVAFVFVAFTMQGMNTVLDSTSGVSCVGTIGAALRERQSSRKIVGDKKKCA